MKIVPSEPTNDMTLAGARSIGQTMGVENHTLRAADCYSAMLNAAPDVREALVEMVADIINPMGGATFDRSWDAVAAQKARHKARAVIDAIEAWQPTGE